MKGRIKVIGLGTILIVFVTSGTWLFLQQFSCACKQDSYNSTDWAQVLNLNKEQQEKLAVLESHISPERSTTKTQLSQVRLLLCDLLRKSELKKEDIEKYTEELARIQAGEEKRTVLHLLEIKKLLTPEQDLIFFKTIMKDICENCRNHTDTHDCQCGFCDTSK